MPEFINDISITTTDNVEELNPTFINEAEERPGIKVIGIGGGGSNAVNNMYRKGIVGDVDFIVCNTDIQALKSSPVPGRLAIGQHGAGGDPKIGAQRAREHADEIMKACAKNTRMVFLAACMGGGTGTGAAPVIAETIKKIELDDPDVKDILIVAIVTLPFNFEGKKKLRYAKDGIAELRKYADSVIVINNNKLRSYGNMTFPEALSKADDILYTATKGIAEIIAKNDYINTDFHDVYNIMSGSKTALMGIGFGEGEDRVKTALENAASSVLLDDQDIRRAKGCLVNITFSSEHAITMDEFDFLSNYVQDEIVDSDDPDSNVKLGTGINDELGEQVQITLIATGFNNPQDDEIVIEKSRDGVKTEPSHPVTPKVESEIKQEQSTATSRTEDTKKEEVITIKKETTVSSETTQKDVNTSANRPQPERPSNTQRPSGEIIINIDDDTLQYVDKKTPENSVQTEATASTKPTLEEPDGIKIHPQNDEIGNQPKSEPVAEAGQNKTVDTNASSTTIVEPKAPKITTESDFRSRMARMRELLKMRQGGSDIVANMNPVGEDAISVDPTSHLSEAVNAYVGTNGNIVGSPNLYNNPD